MTSPTTTTLAANPRDAALWLVAGDHAEEHGTKRTCPKCGGGKLYFDSPTVQARSSCPLCHGSGEFFEATYCRAKALALWWEPGNEAWHGEEQYLCSGTKATYATRPTFALLYDHIEQVTDLDEDGFHTRYPTIPGHHRVLVADLRGLGLEEIAARVEAVRVDEPWLVAPGHMRWKLVNDDRRMIFTTYPDACREACRRIWAALTEPCECKGNPLGIHRPYPGGWDKCNCLGLGFKLRF